MRYLVCLFLILGACATNPYAEFVGRPVTDALLSFGEPSQVLDLDNGQRAYQWEQDSATAVQLPYNPNNSFSRAVGPVAVAKKRVCRDTLIAEFINGQWIAVETLKQTCS